jgi:hypothetical protein
VRLAPFADWIAANTTLPTPGDANRNGVIDADDFALLDRGYANGLFGWSNGDFSGDGVVGEADYLILDSTFAQAGNALTPALLAEREATFGSEYVESLLVAIPEPGSALALAGWAVAGLAGRQRQRRGLTGKRKG